jgi:phosphoribosyl-ATP pyrophosphohydrolase
MFTNSYVELLSNKKISKICSKAYGLELLILIYNFTKNNNEIGIEETFEMIYHNRCKRPAFLAFVKDLENEKILERLPSKVKKSRTLLRLNKEIVLELDKVNNF